MLSVDSIEGFAADSAAGRCVRLPGFANHDVHRDLYYIRLIEMCRDDGRALVTLDLDLGNPLLFKPSD
jgi:hypothetical protein